MEDPVGERRVWVECERRDRARVVFELDERLGDGCNPVPGASGAAKCPQIVRAGDGRGSAREWLHAEGFGGRVKSLACLPAQQAFVDAVGLCDDIAEGFNCPSGRGNENAVCNP